MTMSTMILNRLNKISITRLNQTTTFPCHRQFKISRTHHTIQNLQRRLRQRPGRLTNSTNRIRITSNIQTITKRIRRSKATIFRNSGQKRGIFTSTGANRIRIAIINRFNNIRGRHNPLISNRNHGHNKHIGLINILYHITLENSNIMRMITSNNFNHLHMNITRYNRYHIRREHNKALSCLATRNNMTTMNIS